MKKLPEIVPADHNVKINFYIVLAIYILLLVSLESIIDYFLLININGSNIPIIEEIDKKKKVIVHTAYGMLRILPMLLLGWFGYRILSSAKLPPARMNLPFAVPLQSGRKAKIIGFVLMSLSLLFIAQGMAYTIQQLIS